MKTLGRNAVRIVFLAAARGALAALAMAVLAGARPAAATTYLPITDADLIQRSAVVVRGTVVDARVAEGEIGLVTVYRFRVAETWKGGSAPQIEVSVPGGSDGRQTTYFWGMPEFRPGDEEVLFLNAGRDGRFRISELLLGAFEVVEDARGKQFAMRVHLALGDVGYARVERDDAEPSDAPEPARELAAFREVVRAPHSFTARARLVEASHTMTGTLLPRNGGRRAPNWVLLSPPTQVRFNWSPGGQATATVGYTPGGQANVSDGSAGIPHIATAVSSWVGVSGTDIRLGAPTSGTSGVTIAINLNVTADPYGNWTTPLCGGGVIGLGGPSWNFSSFTYAGGSWYPIVSGNVWMRAYSCSTAAATFVNVLAHELGHVLGFGHSDQGVDARDTDTTNNCLATMKSCLGACGTVPCNTVNNLRFPFTLGGDDMEVARFVYQGSGPVATKFFPLPPCRVLDTRNANGPLGGPALNGSGAQRLFTIAGTCDIPVSARSVSANLTVTQQTSPGSLTVYPGNSSPTGTTSISFVSGRTRANNAFLYLATDGTGSIGVENDSVGSVHFILDVNGYFQ
jgi:hypothetical protein